MKYLVSIFIITLIFSCGDRINVEVGNKTTMQVEPIFDAGEILKGEVITANFKIINTGEYPLVIGEVKASCSCTVAEYPEDPIPPGQSGSILAYVNSEKVAAGILNKSVRVVANTEPSITQLIIKANVIRR